MQSNIRTFQKDTRFPFNLTPAPESADGARASLPAERGADLYVDLRQDLASIFETVDNALKELERAKAALHQRTAALGAERDAHHAIKGEHRKLAGEHRISTRSSQPPRWKLNGSARN